MRSRYGPPEAEAKMGVLPCVYLMQNKVSEQIRRKTEYPWPRIRKPLLSVATPAPAARKARPRISPWRGMTWWATSSHWDLAAAWDQMPREGHQGSTLGIIYLKKYYAISAKSLPLFHFINLSWCLLLEFYFIHTFLNNIFILIKWKLDTNYTNTI